MKVNSRLTIEADMDASLRGCHYEVEASDKDGRKTMGFRFFVTDKGHILLAMGESLVEEEASG